MVIFLISGILLILIFLVALFMFSYGDTGIKYSKRLFLIVSFYIWFRFINDKTIDIILDFIKTDLNSYTSNLEIIVLVIGVGFGFIVEIFLSSLFLEFLFLFIFSNILFTYLNLLIEYKLMQMNINQNIFYLFISFIVGVIIYGIIQFVSDSKSNYKKI